jgi:hypothetical protein
MEPYIEIFGPALIVALACYVLIRRGWARRYEFWRWWMDRAEDQAETEERAWHPSEHYRGNEKRSADRRR